MNANGSGLHPVRTGVAFTFLTDWGRAALALPRDRWPGRREQGEPA